jgi:hypothetical protein
VNVYEDPTVDLAETVDIEPARRGALVITRRAAQHVSERALSESPLGVHHPKVAVQALDDRGVELRSEFGIDYPDEALSPVLALVREHVRARVSAVLGRPVRVLDLVVDELVPRSTNRRVG